MATIRRHRDKFQVRIRRTGFPTITKTFAKLQDAKEWGRHQERQADRGELGPDRKVLETITLADLVRRYKDDVLPSKKGGSVEAIMLTAFLRHAICKKRLSDLTVTDFGKFRDDKLAGTDGKPGITPKSVKRLLSPVQHMFELAMTDWEVPLRENPLARFKLKVTDNKRQRRLRDGELDRLLLAGEKTQNRLVVPIIRVALETGMRRGEILALRPRDIDLERASVTVRESKNGYARTIPLSPTALTVLAASIDGMSDDDRKRNARMFPMAPNALLLSWNRLVRRAKIDDLHFHDLRHEAISRLFELGLTVPEVASVSGHRTLAQLMRYSHANHASIRAKISPKNELPSGPHKTPRGSRPSVNDNAPTSSASYKNV